MFFVVNWLIRVKICLSVLMKGDGLSNWELIW